MTTPPAALQLPTTLRVNRWRKLFHSLFGLLLVGGGAWITWAALAIRSSRRPGDVLLVSLFGVGLALLGVWMGAGVPKQRLQLTEDGFTFENPWHFRRTKRLRWKDVADDFCVIVVRRNGIPVSRLIAWKYSPEFRKPTFWRKLNGAMGWDDSIPAGFGGLSAEELATLMSRVRDERSAQQVA